MNSKTSERLSEVLFLEQRNHLVWWDSTEAIDEPPNFLLANVGHMTHKQLYIISFAGEDGYHIEPFF